MVVFLDLQLEYVSEGRPPFIAAAIPAVTKCASLLKRVRQLKLPIAHFRFIQSTQEFNRASAFSLTIDDVRPRANEYVYEHSLPSCFSNKAFAELMRNVEAPKLLIAGIGERAMLSTVIDGYHRGCIISVVHDCAASGPLYQESEVDTHQALGCLMSSFAEVLQLNEVLRRLDRSKKSVAWS